MIFRRTEAMSSKWHELADYNMRVSQGIVHTPEYAARMATLQAEFNETMYGPDAAAIIDGQHVLIAYKTESDRYDRLTRGE